MRKSRHLSQQVAKFKTNSFLMGFIDFVTRIIDAYLIVLAYILIVLLQWILCAHN